MTNDKKIELLKEFTFIRPIDERILKAIDVCIKYEITVLHEQSKQIEELKAEITELRDSKLKDVKEINDLEAENETLNMIITKFKEVMKIEVNNENGVITITPKGNS